MYYKDYTGAKANITQAIKQNHKTQEALLSKVAAKVRGRAGRWRGKSGRQENNKARGGNMAR